MNLVLDRSMCRPDALARWGMVGYAQSLDDDVVALRAGPLPLRLAARGVFGEKATDVVLPTQGVRQLLTLPENIQYPARILSRPRMESVPVVLRDRHYAYGTVLH